MVEEEKEHFMANREAPENAKEGLKMIYAKKRKIEIDTDNMKAVGETFAKPKQLKSVGDAVIEKAPVKIDKSKQKSIDTVSRALGSNFA